MGGSEEKQNDHDITSVDTAGVLHIMIREASLT